VAFPILRHQNGAYLVLLEILFIHQYFCFIVKWVVYNMLDLVNFYDSFIELELGTFKRLLNYNDSDIIF
jgi:hypothetical protein